ncbi:MAG: bifunctional enoyl-CoA hydratase/phosphate acetyltransferase [Armatimonadetes bacterium]|nr:bifunctional enoyl-CoA hydratase/phosphate acetyltransferase [Armatimonadota bacterium]
MLNFQELINKTKEIAPKNNKKIVLCNAEDYSSLEALKEISSLKLASGFILTGNKLKIEKYLKELNLFKLVSQGKADLLMKGLIHTDILLKAVLDKEIGLRAGKVISHTFLVQVPAYHKLLFITDAVMNISPNLDEKKIILQNAINLALKLEYKEVKSAVLSAVEEVNSKMPSTIDAACLSKMAERGQIKGALVDGPLAFDNAVSKRAAGEKGIKSLVAGDADILLMPHIEAGNAVFKALTYFAQAQISGIVIGAKAPIILTSRSDTKQSKFNSIILALNF